jgi:hypothetical protein
MSNLHDFKHGEPNQLLPPRKRLEFKALLFLVTSSKALKHFSTKSLSHVHWMDIASVRIDEFVCL